MYLCCLLPLRDILPTVMAPYSLFVLKVPLNPKQTNKQSRTVQDLDIKFPEHTRTFQAAWEPCLNSKHKPWSPLLMAQQRKHPWPLLYSQTHISIVLPTLFIYLHSAPRHRTTEYCVFLSWYVLPRAGSGVVRIDLLLFLAGCRER